jgi:hypothetical protein
MDKYRGKLLTIFPSNHEYPSRPEWTEPTNRRTRQTDSAATMLGQVVLHSLDSFCTEACEHLPHSQDQKEQLGHVDQLLPIFGFFVLLI